jgi:hypothetical protein
LYSEYFTKNDLEGFGDFIGGGQILRRVKRVDDFVLLAEEETVLQCIIDCKMIWNGNWCGKTKVMGIPRQQSPIQIMIDKNQLENVEYFKYFRNMITN